MSYIIKHTSPNNSLVSTHEYKSQQQIK